MLDISRPEKFFILMFLIFGVCCTSFSHYKKIVSNREIRTFNIDENCALVNINRASLAQLEYLPGIGPILAKDIILYREKIGGFKRVEELKDVKGIGNKKFEKIKNLISIE